MKKVKKGQKNRQFKEFQEGEKVKKYFVTFATICTLVTICTFVTFVAYAGISGTKHDLSVGGPGPIKATEVTEKCVFCHTPHASSGSYPLWNHKLSEATYTVYTSLTLFSWGTPANPSPPDGSSKLCLGCHDGTVGIGLVLNTPGRGTTYPAQIEMTDSGAGYLDAQYRLTTSAPGYIGTYILGNPYHIPHPVSIAVNDDLINDKLLQCQSGSGGSLAVIKYPGSSYPEVKLRYTDHQYTGEYGENHNGVQCRTCHDPHNNQYGKFLVINFDGSNLCYECHCVTNPPTDCSCP